jgi:hypothetical protein
MDTDQHRNLSSREQCSIYVSSLDMIRLDMGPATTDRTTFRVH